jgi:excisionase family DNA binding protein
LTIFTKIAILKRGGGKTIMNTPQPEYVTATEATRLLDVSKVKMAKLLRSGEIPYIPDPRNQRAKLIKRCDIDAWLAKAPRPKVAHRRGGQVLASEDQTR